MNILLIVTSATFLWRRSESIARPAFIRADEKGGNSVKSRTQKLRGKDGSLLDEDKFWPTDERRTVEVREFDAATARRQCYWYTR